MAKQKKVERTVASETVTISKRTYELLAESFVSRFRLSDKNQEALLTNLEKIATSGAELSLKDADELIALALERREQGLAQFIARHLRPTRSLTFQEKMKQVARPL